jgi:nucleotide-binding universal stress UspA family protein
MMGIAKWFCSYDKNSEEVVAANKQRTSASTASTASTTTTITASAPKESKGIMSTIAARILNKYHDHEAMLYREVGHKHRLSYADLDALLDREEKALATEKERQRRLQAQDPKADLEEGDSEPEPNPLYTESNKSSSGSDDEADWAHHSGGEHEEDLLLELEDSELESVHTVSGAEDHLVNDIDEIVHSHITERQLDRMRRLLGVNCLHRGNISSVKGKRWMVAVDGSESSQRAFQGVLKLMDPAEDHLLIVSVRDKNLPQRFAIKPSEEVQLRFELWKSARHILKPYTDELTTRLAPSHYTVMTPEAWDARRMLCNLCKRYNIDTLCVGKHAKSEHNHHHRHLRSLHSYTTSHAHCQVIVF